MTGNNETPQPIIAPENFDLLMRILVAIDRGAQAEERAKAIARYLKEEGPGVIDSPGDLLSWFVQMMSAHSRLAHIPDKTEAILKAGMPDRAEAEAFCTELEAGVAELEELNAKCPVIVPFTSPGPQVPPPPENKYDTGRYPPGAWN